MPRYYYASYSNSIKYKMLGHLNKLQISPPPTRVELGTGNIHRISFIKYHQLRYRTGTGSGLKKHTFSC